jgi:hypothetical protein
METVCFSETLVSTYEFIWRLNSEEQHLHRRENLRSNIRLACWLLRVMLFISLLEISVL